MNICICDDAQPIHAAIDTLEPGVLPGRIWLRVENPTVEQRGEIAGLRSTKPDPKAHGCGLKSIRSIAEKYDGTVCVTWENSRFVIELGLANRAEA